MLDQHTRMLLQIAEARRMHGTSERDGTVHQVWRQGKEQKVRLNIGTRPDGSPWLSPWIKIEDHHGPSRKQHKFHKGQNVKMTTPGADFSQAKVTPSGENNAHPEPEHADDIHNTEQYAASRVRTGPDFEERWLASGGQVTGTDPDQVSVVLKRWGAKPQNDNDKGQPWDGPDPNQASPQKRDLKWAGEPGNTPTQNGDAITTQFDQNVKTETTGTGILHKVQSGGTKMTIPDSGDGSASKTTIDNMKDGNILRKINDLMNQLQTITEHTSGQIAHTIMDQSGAMVTKVMQKNQIIHQIQDSGGNISTILQQAGMQLLQVGSSSIQITDGQININSQSISMNGGDGMSSSSAPSIPSVDSTGNAPLITFAMNWSINSVFSINANMPISWPIGASFVIATSEVPSHWNISASLAALSRIQLRWPINAHLNPVSKIGPAMWPIGAHFII